MIRWLQRADDPLPNAREALGAGSEAPGLVAAGGGLGVARLAEAYGKGIFPWYSRGQPILWWSPDPRMVLLPEEFKVARSLRKTLQRFVTTPGCELRVDRNFSAVITACATSPRGGEAGTWIVPEMIAAYCRWHEAGCAHSFETWIDGELAGGLYGVSLGRMFFGESMFTRRTDASKIALAGLVAFCRSNQIQTIDCQQRTSHLASFGGREFPRDCFLGRLEAALALQPVTDWTYDFKMWTEIGIDQTSAGGRASR
ncbi:MAG: leucyl/phenylalanyl-tRNA--protein transferase [Pseudomonadota bacterium]|nr:leucyl/phenylalanyl-tRNA--protein transferase [Pseudomonadota bacterium]